MLADEDPTAFNARIEALTRALDTSADVDARRAAGELVRLVLEFHSLGLQRLLRIVADGPSSIQQRIVGDPVVAGLLELHGVNIPENSREIGQPSRGAVTPLIQINRGSNAVAAASGGDHEGERSRCERCGTPLGAAHHHHVDVLSRRLSCSCRACWLLSGAHAQGSLRAVPDRYLAGPSLRITDAQWDALQLPVATAFFMFNSTIGRTIAFYPSPAGATESALLLAAWRDVEQSNGWMRTAAPDVEAVLVRRDSTVPARFEAVIVPIDACYDLVGRIKVNWRGLDGGEQARAQIDRFFREVVARSVTSTESLAGHS